MDAGVVQIAKGVVGTECMRHAININTVGTSTVIQW